MSSSIGKMPKKESNTFSVTEPNMGSDIQNGLHYELLGLEVIYKSSSLFILKHFFWIEDPI